jgi:hypothetical protein
MARNLPPCVVVERLPFGSSSFTLATVDEFTRGELTITAEDGRVMEVYKLGTWLRATQYDSHGWSLYTFTSEEAHRQAVEARNLLRELAQKYDAKGAA